MEHFLISLMIYGGSVLMAYNVYRYVSFAGKVRRHGRWDQERFLLNMPIVLLTLFLLGYLMVGIAGKPDLVIAGILFGGSVFVFVILLLIQRIYRRIQENEHLEAQLSAAEEANRAKTFFLSNMSHDIRTPLNAIIGYTTLAKNEDLSQAEQRDYIGKIEKAGHQLLEIVNDVLEMSRIETGKMELNPTQTNLETCVREAGDLVRMQMAARQIDFTVQCDVQHPWVCCDRNLLNRALMNLLSNAMKFTGEKGQVSIRLTELSTDGNTGNYEIHVRDTGIGMSPDFVEHLFSPFEREKTSTVSGIQGTGLGMAITKNILDMMGGKIEVQTVQGQGTAFTITVSFPLVNAPEEKKTSSPMQVSFEGLRALLVEDNQINMEIAQLMLTQAGFAIETAENGQVAVDKVAASEKGYYDVILMDIQMPVMDGYAATGAIRALPDPDLAGIPIIAMTANAFQEDIHRAETAGMNGHIAKPLDIPDMMATLRSVLEKETSR